MPRSRLAFVRLAAVALPLAAAALSAQSSGTAPLSIARQGYFYAGGKYSTVGERQVMSGQLFVEFQPNESSFLAARSAARRYCH